MRNMVFWLLVGVVVLSPLPFASNRPWAWSLLGVVVALLLLAWSLDVLMSRPSRLIAPSRIWPIALLFGLPVLWAVIQSLTFTPASWHHPAWARAQVVLGPELQGSISIDREATLTAVMRLLSYGGVFWLALQYCCHSRNARHLLYAIAVFGLGYALYGLAIQFSGANLVLWFEKWAYRNYLTSTFVNRNSYATYAGLTLMCILGLLAREAPLPNPWEVGWRTATRQVVNGLVGRGWFLLLAAIVVTTALLLTASRGGFFSAGLGLIVLFLGVAAAQRITRHLAIPLVLLVAVAAVGILSLSGEELEKRLGQMSGDVRPILYATTIDAIRDNPVMGTGYGTFEQVFRGYRDKRLSRGKVYYARAHNTYLENALELGIPAAVSLGAAILGLGILCLRGVRRRRRNGEYPSIGLAATALVGVHSLVDFSLQIPAVAVTYAAIMGAACAQSWGRSRATTGHPSSAIPMENAASSSPGGGNSRPPTESPGA